MAQEKFLNPMTGDEVPKVDDAVAIGEDLAFQERWWTFERIIWTFFALVLLADALGLFGRGWLAKGTLDVPQSAVVVKYERVERTMTPSLLDIKFQPDAVQNGAVHLFISDTVVKELGTQRVAPQPQSSVIGNNGITYTFPVNGMPAEVQLGMMPASPGVYPFVLQVPGKAAVDGHVVVMP